MATSFRAVTTVPNWRRPSRPSSARVALPSRRRARVHLRWRLSPAGGRSRTTNQAASEPGVRRHHNFSVHHGMKANNTANYLAAVAINDGFRRPADRFDSGKKVVVVDVAKGEDLTLYQRALLRVD